jgi:nucleoside-diphosphate-sugar epimerase
VKQALVCGGGGFIGSHLVKRLKKENFWVRAVDLKLPEFGESAADDFIVADLRDPNGMSTFSIVPSMKCISWRPIWVAPGTYLRETMMQMLCTIVQPLI